MQKITPFLWYDGKAEEAAAFYVSIFANSRINSVTHSGASGPGPAGSVMSVAFELDGQPFIALNGGPHYSFTPAISFFIDCHSQAEVDDLWERLSDGGEKGRCGWLKDKYGLSWQVIPRRLGDLLQEKDEEKSAQAMQAMQGMDKLDIERLERAQSRQ